MDSGYLSHITRGSKRKSDGGLNKTFVLFGNIPSKSYSNQLDFHGL